MGYPPSALFVGFYQRLHTSARREVRMMVQHMEKDAQSVTGRNTLHIEREFGGHPKILRPRKIRHYSFDIL